jgi:hypothetical protein
VTGVQTCALPISQQEQAARQLQATLGARDEALRRAQAAEAKVAALQDELADAAEPSDVRITPQR